MTDKTKSPTQWIAVAMMLFGGLMLTAFLLQFTDDLRAGVSGGFLCLMGMFVGNQISVDQRVGKLEERVAAMEQK